MLICRTDYSVDITADSGFVILIARVSRYRGVVIVSRFLGRTNRGEQVRGDSIFIEAHHVKAAKGITKILLPQVESSNERRSLSIAGESGSGKSEIAAALRDEISQSGIRSVILQQDDYFVYPPKTNDQTRRRDINWVGPGEVRLEVLDDDIESFLNGEPYIQKPLIIYSEDRITDEILELGGVQLIIVEGTYTSLLTNVMTRVFIDRNYLDTERHRQRRMRDQSELDPFIEQVLSIEHQIISQHRFGASIAVNKDYSVTAVS